MKQSQLLENVRVHEQMPQSQFLVREIREIKDGMVAVLDEEGEYTVYFD
jgi:hypothetical protein